MPVLAARHSEFPCAVQLPQQPAHPVPRLAPEAPALEAMTDFAVECPVVVAPERHIDDALQDMKLFGVRALVVLEDGSVRGLISAYDILGERPIQFLSSPNCTGNPCRRADIHVADVMTPLEDLPVLNFTWVRGATLRDVRTVFSATVHMHLLVLQGDVKSNAQVARGLFSRTRLDRHLGRLSAPIA